MHCLLRQLGYYEGSVQDRFNRLNADSQPPAEPDPRPGLLAHYDEILTDSLRRSQSLFDRQPKAPCVVKREPLFTEMTAAAHYFLPARDGSRPGVFRAPLPGPEVEMFGMRTLTNHEAIPGHHFPNALLQAGIVPLPMLESIVDDCVAEVKGARPRYCGGSSNAR